MAVEMTVGPAVADGKLGSLMGLSFFNVDVPPTHTTSLQLTVLLKRLLLMLASVERRQ